MTRLWTGKGDDGTTGLLYGGRAPKASPRFDAVGDVDEAQASIGLARAEAPGGSELDVILIALERDLWVLMAELATDDDNRAKLVPGGSLVTQEMITHLETLADDIGARFELPREFVVPGQDRGSALLDLARTVVRRSERSAAAVAAEDSLVVPYLNRLSSVLFTLARWVEREPLLARGS
jgi:cob(I)alamin adenosyltransferase